MNRITVSLLACVIGALSAPTAFAQGVSDSAPAVTSQSPMAACRETVKGQLLTEEAAKAARKSCLAPARKACREQAVGQGISKGAERKAFVKSCLSAEPK